MKSRSIEARAKDMLRATQIAVEKAENWQHAHNAVFGVGALFSELFPTYEERMEFAKREEYQQIREMIESLPSARTGSNSSGNVLVRMPKSLHAAMIHEAEQEGVSLNQLIVAKLAAQLRDVAHV